MHYDRSPFTGLHIHICINTHTHLCIYIYLILFAFMTGNSNLEHLLQGLLAQIHMDLSYSGFGRNRTCNTYFG